MADTILVVVEQREGKLNRVSLETLAGAQAISAATGWPVEAAVLGSGVSAVALEVAGIKLSKVYQLDSPALGVYTPDAFSYALRQFVAQIQPKLVLMPHTYQVRDFAPKLATALGRSLVSDAMGFKYEGGKLLFMRQMFQGKFAADVAFGGEPPYFASCRRGRSAATRQRRGPARRPSRRLPSRSPTT